tara:strand:- start:334 stop:522 length:189 start_codon:yes stop_codon:yes gene_type:complete
MQATLMKRLRSLFNSQRTAIFILLILNLLQLRYLGFMHMKIKDVQDRLVQIEGILDEVKGFE